MLKKPTTNIIPWPNRINEGKLLKYYVNNIKAPSANKPEIFENKIFGAKTRRERQNLGGNTTP